MRIAHFSDLHFGLWPENFYQALFDKRILGLINYFIRRRCHLHQEFIEQAIQTVSELKPQLVICTGDITSISSEREFNRALAALTPFIQNSDFDFIYVPGNHDHYVRDPHCQHHFRKAFEKLNSQWWKLEELPAIVTYENIDFLVCDECRPTNIFLSSGYIPPPLATRLQDWLTGPRRRNGHRILIGHYPTRDRWGRLLSRRRRLNGGEIILQALREGRLDVSLCGHIHDPFVHRESSGSLEACAGALTVNGIVNVLDIPADRSRPIRQHWQKIKGKTENTQVLANDSPGI